MSCCFFIKMVLFAENAWHKCSAMITNSKYLLDRLDNGGFCCGNAVCLIVLFSTLE